MREAIVQGYHEYRYVYEDGTESMWGHTERHKCPHCGRWQDLADPHPSDGLPVIVEARAMGLDTIIAAFWCRRCEVVSICGAMGGRPTTAHYTHPPSRQG